VSIEQSLGRETDAVFRNHAENHELHRRPKSLYKLFGVPALEDVERLFLEKNLIELQKIVWQRGQRLVRDGDDFLRQSFGNNRGARRAFDAVRRKRLELRIVLRVVAAMRDQKHAALAGSVRKPPNIRKQFFGAGHVELPAGQHEVHLCVDFPENEIAR